MTTEQAKVLRFIAGAVIEAVAAAGPTGAPGGILYAALMAHGCTYDQFTQIMGGLVQAKLLTKSGECYHIAKKEAVR